MTSIALSVVRASTAVTAGLALNTGPRVIKSIRGALRAIGRARASAAARAEGVAGGGAGATPVVEGPGRTGTAVGGARPRAPVAEGVALLAGAGVVPGQC